MKRHQSFLQALAGALSLACLVGVQYACKVDAPGHAESEERMDAERPPATGDGEVHWGYSGETGSERWGGLDSSFAICDGGVQQSPINLAGAIPKGGGGLQIQWQPTNGEVVDTGQTIQVNMEAGSAIILEDRRFSLLELHFHHPSEHTVDGLSFPMEVHFVHKAEQGDLAVIGVFMDAGDAHPDLQAVWDAIPGAEGTVAPLAGFDPNTLLPEGRGYSRYAGSLTTPPCSEEVSWVVMGEPIRVSRAQVDAFAALYPMNARPVQPLHGRLILMR